MIYNYYSGIRLFSGHGWSFTRSTQSNCTTSFKSACYTVIISKCWGLNDNSLFILESAWTSRLKSDNHYYRQCKDRVLSDARAKSVMFDRVIEITDGAPTQFKNRFNMVQLNNVVNKFNLIWAMAVYPPTATFKGEHDGVGNLDKNIIRQAELAEVGRYPTTRSYMPLLWSQPVKTPRALNDPNRRLHEIDEHIRILVEDLPNALPNDADEN